MLTGREMLTEEDGLLQRSKQVQTLRANGYFVNTIRPIVPIYLRSNPYQLLGRFHAYIQVNRAIE